MPKQQKQKYNQNYTQFNTQRDVTASEYTDRMERDLCGVGPIPEYMKHLQNRESLGAALTGSEGRIPPTLKENDIPTTSGAGEVRIHAKQEVDNTPNTSGVNQGSVPLTPADANRAKEDNDDGKTPSHSIMRIKKTRIKPGAPDDLYRKGLSGAGCKWFLRFIKQGIPPLEARKMVDERKTNPSILVEFKRKTDELTPSNNQNSKKNFIQSEADTAKPLSLASAANSIKIAVLPTNFPQSTLTSYELIVLKELLIKEMSLGWNHKLKFNGVLLKTGFLLVNCAGKDTADWLKINVPKLRSWRGIKLTTCLESEVTKMHTVTVFLPKSMDQDEMESLALIQSQNEGLNVQYWKVVKSKTEGRGQLLVLSIDEHSAKRIATLNHKLHYKLTMVNVVGLKNTMTSNLVESGEATDQQLHSNITSIEPNIPSTQADICTTQPDIPITNPSFITSKN
ncbi:uncharacterized protein LOC129944455 [Eupeodes corollae]|uniref:uncharacterized protein LOC129944455 n=1 Tax=Eupeodes corollae TaxID=290404 RepID=UPI002490AD16|nr:uncharacterized protein LOC129944455 [Eupeodes corollae]